MTERSWYAVYTKPRWEKKTAETLTHRGIENYCPLNKVLRQWSDRKKLVQEPLFKSYVFVRVAEKQLPELKKVEGILSVVTWLGKPAAIKDAEIKMIKAFLCEHTNVKVEQAVNVNDTVTIARGSLMNKEGTVVAVKNNFVTVELPSLGYTLHADLAKSDITKTKYHHDLK